MPASEFEQRLAQRLEKLAAFPLPAHAVTRTKNGLQADMMADAVEVIPIADAASALR